MNKSRTSLTYSLIAIGIIFIGICFCLAIVLSLIPIFIANKSAPSSYAGYNVYQLDNIRFQFGSGTSKEISIVRRAAKLVRPTSSMISQLEKQFKKIFGSKNADATITDATIDLSINELVLSLEIRVYSRCSTCSRQQRKLIQTTFEMNLNLSVTTEYILDCNSSPIRLSSNNLQFNRGSYQVSQSFQSSNRKYNDSCPVIYTTSSTMISTPNATTTTMRTLLTDSRGCREILPSGMFFSFNPTDNTTYHYFCYFYTPSNTSRTTTITFLLSGNNADLYTQLDDIQLNSTSGNLIINGDFEDSNYTNQWQVQSCVNCDPGVDDLYSQSGILAFYSSGVGVRLSQNVTIDPILNGNQPFYLSFWLAYECGGNNQCAIEISLHTF